MLPNKKIIEAGCGLAQYVFTFHEVEKYLENTGFETINVSYYDAFKELKDKITVFKSILEWVRVEFPE